MKLPTAYQWLSLEDAPRHMLKAIELYGTQETVGPKHNPVIMGWAKEVGLSSVYTADEIPWCGLFVGHCIDEAGIKVTIENPLLAKEWNNFGSGVQPCYGAIMVFTRDGGGHVGFYVSEDADTYHILGGNQSDMVNITRVGKERLFGARWPKEYIHLVTKPIIAKFNATISRNEA